MAIKKYHIVSYAYIKEFLLQCYVINSYTR